MGRNDEGFACDGSAGVGADSGAINERGCLQYGGEEKGEGSCELHGAKERGVACEEENWGSQAQQCTTFYGFSGGLILNNVSGREKRREKGHRRSAGVAFILPRFWLQT